MALNLRQIEVFRAVMITGSISGAAQLLFVSQPAVSRLLSQTETRIGFALFERIKGRLHATPEAKKLVKVSGAKLESKPLCGYIGHIVPIPLPILLLRAGWQHPLVVRRVQHSPLSSAGSVLCRMRSPILRRSTYACTAAHRSCGMIISGCSCSLAQASPRFPFETVAAVQNLRTRAEYIKVAGNGPNVFDFHPNRARSRHRAVQLGRCSRSNWGRRTCCGEMWMWSGCQWRFPARA